MNRKSFSVPLVFLAEATSDPVPGGYSGGGGDEWNKLKPIPMSFGEWAQSRWCADYDNSGNVTADDYARWWAQCGLGSENWVQFNPDVAWNDEWTK